MDTLLIAIGCAIFIGLIIFTDPLRRYSFYNWCLWIIGLVCVILIVHWMKVWIGCDASWKRRPNTANKCDLLERSVNNAGEPGFPSGHAAFATYYVIGLWWLLKNPLVLIIGIPWVVFVAYSRIHKNCHTRSQVLYGAIVGIIVSIAFVSFWR